MIKQNKQKSAGARIQLQDEEPSSRNFSRKLSQNSVTPLSDADRLKIIEQKVLEIQEEFFSTYLAGQKIECQRKDVPWHEHMTVTSDKALQLDAQGFNDDIQREVQFYTLTLENVQRAIGYLTQENIPVQRPADYAVEMFKAPKQIVRIENHLVKQQRRVQNLEEKRLREQGKKLQKMVKAKRMREEHKEKRQNQALIEEWKREIKIKGSDKAGDLNDFIKKKQSQQQKKPLMRKGQKEGGKKIRPQKEDGVKRKGLFKKGIKAQKMNRPGKVTRMRNKSKQMSQKGHK